MINSTGNRPGLVLMLVVISVILASGCGSEDSAPVDGDDAGINERASDGGSGDSGANSEDAASSPSGLKWVAVPAGSFEMGCATFDPTCLLETSTKPRHQVNVEAFDLLETEVTEAQYKAVTGKDPSEDYNGGGGPDSPVENVTWQEAKAFCEAVGGRLPTEAEWEYAARAGAATTYPCGNDWSCLDDIAWNMYNSGDDNGDNPHKHDVRGKAPSSFGLYDMYGNVWEWVQDCWHDNYNGAPATAYPPWEQGCTGSARIHRGSDFGGDVDFMRAVVRLGWDASGAGDDLGFRCARSR